jgi:hypothetical protein
MKQNITSVLASFLIIACGSNNSTQETKAANATEQQPASAPSESTQPSGDGITGFWKLKLEAYDDNGNKTLDEEERKKGFKNNYTYRFNTDGSCQIQGSFKGRYEEKTESGIKMLYVYRNRVVGEEDKDPVPDVYRIISMSKNELVLLEREGNLTFWVFERAG